MVLMATEPRSGKPLSPYVSTAERQLRKLERDEAKRVAREKREQTKKRKPGSRFPKRRDPEFMQWLADGIKAGEPWAHCCVRGVAGTGFPYGLTPCYGLYRSWAERAHLYSRGAGGCDLGNVVILCAQHHDLQQGRTDEFEREYGIDLQHEARRLATLFLEANG